MKKYFSLLLLALLPLFAQAATLINGIYYNLNSSKKTAEVTSSPNNYTGTVNIPPTVVSVGVTYSVTSIGSSAFDGCSDLTSATIPNSVTSIDFNAFRDCSGLTSVTIGNSVTSIGSFAFSNCSGLTSVTIPNSVTIIGSFAFQYCSGLTSVTIPNSVTSIGERAFSFCSGLTSVTIGNSVTSIGSSAFKDCSGLTSVTIPNSVISIGYEAFSGCSGLTSVTIPYSVTSIGEYAFNSCRSLTSVTIGNSVTFIGYKAFGNCSSITDFYCLAETIPTTDSDVFSRSNISDATLHVPASAVESYSNTTPWSGFGNIVALVASDIIEDENHITFADMNVRALCMANWDTDKNGSLSYVEAAAVTDLGEVFTDNTDITSFDELQYFTGLISIGKESFKGCGNLNSVSIPNSVTTIDNNAFQGCTSLTSVHITDLAAWCNISFKSIESNPLYYAHDLYIGDNKVTDLFIPESVTTISNYSFIHCKGLTSVTIPNSVTSIGNSVFQGCTGLTSVNISNNVTTIRSFTFYGCRSLTSVDIPEKVKSIGKSAFNGCSGLNSVTIPKTVTSIGESAFANCGNLPNVYCYALNVPTTQSNAFDNTNIESSALHVPRASIDNYFTTIPWSGFGYFLPVEIVEDENHISFADMNVWALCMANWDTDENGSLSYVEAAAVTSLGEVFADNADITSFDELQYFTGLTGIDDNAFMGCSNLASVTLPENISSIGAYAFYGCKALTTFTIPQGVSEVGAYAFRGCTGLTDVYCVAQDVPVTASNAFNNSNIGNATLHVVVSSYNAYKNALPWKNFKNMLGDIPVPCAAPVISYRNGQIVFDCDTEGVTFKSDITCEDIAAREESTIDLTVAYTITVYATKEGYNPSETVTATLCWIETEPVDAVATGTLEIAAMPVLVKSRGGVITVEGVGNGTTVSVYTTGGMLVGSATAVDRTATVSTSLPAGTVAVVKIGEKAVKIVVR